MVELWRRSTLQWGDSCRALVALCPTKTSNSARICQELGDKIFVTGYWEPKMVAPVVALNALTQGTGPTIHVAVETSENSLTALHEDCVREGRCLVVSLGDDTEVVFAPVQTQKGASPHVLFWGYCVLRGVVSCGSLVFENGGQLPAVFDLDETLVMANSSHNLSQRLDTAARQMQGIKSQLESCSGAEERENLQSQIAALEHEQNLLREDHQMVQSYAEGDSVVLNGKTFTAREELVESGSGVTSRPVIRIPEAGVVLTRIDPSKSETSMVIRIRPGWDALHAYLSGQMENKRQKWKVFVCTAAEREYALEVWRLLDTAGDLIPPAERALRIFAGARKKSLMHTLGLGPFSSEALPAHCASGASIAPLVEGVSEMPLALIIDDRNDVWDRRNRSQIVQVTPYLHYKNNRFSNKLPKYDENELMRVKSIFQNLRAELYFRLCEKMTKALAAMMSQGVAAEDKLAKLLSDTPTFAVVLDQVVSKPWAPPEERTNENWRDENNQHNGISLKPQDPRLQTPREGNSVTAEDLLLPRDPRSQKLHSNLIPDDPRMGQKQTGSLELERPKVLQAQADGLGPGPKQQTQQACGPLEEKNLAGIPVEGPRPGQLGKGSQTLASSTMPMVPGSQTPEAGPAPTDPHHILMGPAQAAQPRALDKMNQQQDQQQGSTHLLDPVGHQFQFHPVFGNQQALMPSGTPATAPLPAPQVSPNVQAKNEPGFQAFLAGLQPVRGPGLGLRKPASLTKPANFDAPIPHRSRNSSEKGVKVHHTPQLSLPTLANIAGYQSVTSNLGSRFTHERHHGSEAQATMQGIGQLMQLQALSSVSGAEVSSNLQALQAAAARALAVQTQPLRELPPLQSEALAAPIVQPRASFLQPDVGMVQQGMARQPVASIAGCNPADVFCQGGMKPTGVLSSSMAHVPDRLPAPLVPVNELPFGKTQGPLRNVSPGMLPNKPQAVGTVESELQIQQGPGTVTHQDPSQQVPLSQSLHPPQQQVQDPRIRQAFFGSVVRPVLLPQQQHQTHPSLLPISASMGTIFRPGPGPQQPQAGAMPPLQGSIKGLPKQDQCRDLSPLGTAPLQVMTPQGGVSIAPTGPKLTPGVPYIALQTPHGVVLLRSQAPSQQSLPGCAQNELAGTIGPPDTSQAAGASLDYFSGGNDDGSAVSAPQTIGTPVLAVSSSRLPTKSSRPQQRPPSNPRGPLATTKRKWGPGRGHVQNVAPGAGGAGCRVVPQGRKLGNNRGKRQPVQRLEKLGGGASLGMVSSPGYRKQRGGKRALSQAVRALGGEKGSLLYPCDADVTREQQGSGGALEQATRSGTASVSCIDLGPQAAAPDMRYKAEATRRLPNGVNVTSEGWGPTQSAARQAAADNLMHQQQATIASSQQQQQQSSNVTADDGRRDRERRAPCRDTSLQKTAKRPRRVRRRDLDAAANWGTSGPDYGQANLTGYVAQLADGLDDGDAGASRIREDDEEEEGEIK